MKRLLLSIAIIFIGCSHENPVEVKTEPLIIAAPSITLSPKLFFNPLSETYYVITVGTILSNYERPLYPVKTELNLYFSYDNFLAHNSDLAASGRIGFFGNADTLDYATDTLRVGVRMHHYTKTSGFYWSGGDIYYDFRAVVGGIVAKRSGVLHEEDTIDIVYRGMFRGK